MKGFILLGFILICTNQMWTEGVSIRYAADPLKIGLVWANLLLLGVCWIFTNGFKDIL